MHIHGLWNDFEKGIAKVSSVRVFSIYNKDFQRWVVGERRHMESAQTSFQMNAWVGKRNTDFLIYKYIFLCFICHYYMEVLWISTEMTACVFSWSFALILFQWQFVMFCITNTCYSKCSMFEQCFSYKLSDDLTLCAKRFPHPWVDRAICMICIKFWDCIFTEKKCMCNLSLASYMFFIIWV